MSSTIRIEARESFSTATFLARQNRILEMVALCAPLENILDSVARLIESQAPGSLCSISLLDEDRRLRHYAAPTLTKAYARAVDGIRTGPKAGLCGTAAYRRERVIVRDILEDPLSSDYRELAINHGLRACWTSPFFSSQGHVLGTFAMYYRTPRLPFSTDTELLEVAARICGTTVEQWQRIEGLQYATETYRTLVENLNDIVFSLDIAGNITYVNPRIEILSGYSAGEVVGERFSRLVHPGDLHIFEQNLVNTLAGDLTPCDFRVLSRRVPYIGAAAHVGPRSCETR